MKRTRSSIEVARVSSVFYFGETVFSVYRMDVSRNVLSRWLRSMMRCCAKLWTSWHLKELALLSFDQMPLGIMRRLPLRRGRGEGSNVSGVRLASKLMG